MKRGSTNRQVRDNYQPRHHQHHQQSTPTRSQLTLLERLLQMGIYDESNGNYGRGDSILVVCVVLAVSKEGDVTKEEKGL